MRKVIKVFSDVLFVAGLIIAGLFLAAHFTGSLPFQVYIVSSGSMSPTIPTGSLVLVVPQRVYRVGDIVSFRPSDNAKSTTTHRIVGSSEGFFKVAGDANNQPDPGLVPNSAVVGSVRWTLPAVGYLSAWAKTPRGFILFIIVPATIIIYEELKSLGLEIKKLLSRWQPKVETKPTLRLHPAIIILPVIFAILISVSISLSFFIDHETSAGNIFKGAAPTPTPTPTPAPTPTPL